MFKTSVITDEISQNLSVAIELAKKFSLDAVEIRSVDEKNPFQFTTDDVLMMKKQLDSAGLCVSAISAPFYKCDMNNEEEIAEHLQGLKRCIEAAKILNTNIIRGFTFWKNGELSDCIPRIVELYKKPQELLMETGIILALEFDPSVNATNGQELLQVLNAIDSPLVQALWDPGNDLYAENFEIPYPDGYNYVKPYIAHVHIKDAILDQNNAAVGCCFGCGLVDYKAQLKQLIDDCYSGYVTMETHYRKTSVISQEKLKNPSGSEFSAGGYESTAECFEKMFDMLSNINK